MPGQFPGLQHQPGQFHRPVQPCTVRRGALDLREYVVQGLFGTADGIGPIHVHTGGAEPKVWDTNILVERRTSPKRKFVLVRGHPDGVKLEDGYGLLSALQRQSCRL